MPAISTKLSFPWLPMDFPVWRRFRLALAVHRTRASIAHLTQDQLLDIGLGPDDREASLDEHQRHWRMLLLQDTATP